MLDQDLSFLQCVEELPVQEFIPELTVERLYVTILPGTSGLDVERLHTDLPEPVPNRRRRKLCPVVRANVIWRPALNEELKQPLQDVLRAKTPSHAYRKALTRVLIYDHQHPDRTAIVRAIEDEVVDQT